MHCFIFSTYSLCRFVDSWCKVHHTNHTSGLKVGKNLVAFPYRIEWKNVPILFSHKWRDKASIMWMTTKDNNKTNMCMRMHHYTTPPPPHPPALRVSKSYIVWRWREGGGGWGGMDFHAGLSTWVPNKHLTCTKPFDIIRNLWKWLFLEIGETTRGWNDLLPFTITNLPAWKCQISKGRTQKLASHYIPLPSANRLSPTPWGQHGACRRPNLVPRVCVYHRGSQRAAVEWRLHKLTMAVNRAYLMSGSTADSKCSNNSPEIPLRLKGSRSNDKETSIRVLPSVPGPSFPWKSERLFDHFGSPVKKSLGLPGKWRAQHTRKDLYWCFLDIWSTPLQSKRNFGRVIWTFWIGRWLTYAWLTAMTNLCRRHSTAARWEPPCCLRRPSPMAAERRVDEFRSALSFIADHITNGKLDKMKFLCEDNLRPTTLEKVRTAEDLFRELQSAGLLRNGLTEFLEDLLRQCEMEPLIPKLDAFKGT